MGGVILDAKVPPDHGRDARGRPDLADEPVGLRALRQQAEQLGPLRRRQFRLGAGSWPAPQRLDAALPHAAQPLADGAFAHPQRGGDLALAPALLFEFPGPQPAAFAPVPRRAGRGGRIGAHTRSWGRSCANFTLPRWDQ